MKQRLIDANEIAYYADEQGFEYAYKADIDNLPTIDLERLRPTAHWIYGGGVGAYVWSCSKCNSSQYVCSRYCPDCGSFMEN